MPTLAEQAQILGPGKDRRAFVIMLKSASERILIVTRRLTVATDTLEVLDRMGASKISIVINHLNNKSGVDLKARYPNIDFHITSDLIASSCYLTEHDVLLTSADILTRAHRNPFRVSTRIARDQQPEAYNRASNMMYASYEYALSPERFIKPGCSKQPEGYLAATDIAKLAQAEVSEIQDTLIGAGYLHYDGIKLGLTQQARDAGAYQVFRRRRSETFWPSALVQHLSSAA